MSLTYRDSGVNIDAGNEFVRRIAPYTASTRRPEVLSSIGGFGALCDLPGGYRRPVLVSSTDGAGTKVMISQFMDKHDTIGIDAVAMCVNDLVVVGAEPLFFLDYFVTGKLDINVGAAVIAGVAEGCRQAGCSLIGGETAEHPGHMEAGSYDIAGFSVGVVEHDQIIDGRSIQKGDAIIGMASTGVHSNGFSLVRKIMKDHRLSYEDYVAGFRKPLGEVLLTPTQIYVKPVLGLIKEVEVRGLAHITGGGLTENVPRILPEGNGAVFNLPSWPVPPIFGFLANTAGVDEAEMFRTFNMGLGMVAVVPEKQAVKAVSFLAEAGINAWVVGEITDLPGVTYRK
ncbi:MAG TPA: phosphoribosylformylglycinamidine cyclo-ligase [Firmicutes bacterium]|jgi:phosphoribosylformylglycinamidine cyclo-ligase|nr:phosphoribosylformylglycinamidine cyclo-ligase [Bacillota bacterium]HCF91987.1 phosphoribosylformylglycinamidine cyclo-ligase [Bacillota bacterium]